MKLNKFLDENNDSCRIQVIAPTSTYGTMFSVNSRYDFDEYDKNGVWEFNVIVDNNIVASFDSITETKSFIETTHL